MQRIMTGMAVILSLAPQIANAAPVQVLKATPGQVHLEPCNVLEERQLSLVIRNTGNDVVTLDDIKADCSCVRINLTETEIAPGNQVKLEIRVMPTTEGNFSHAILLIPRDKERHRALTVHVRGQAIQPVAGAVGWQGSAPVPCEPARVTELGIVHRSAVRPVVYIAGRGSHFDVRDAVIDVHSTAFELHDYRFVSPPDQTITTLQTSEGNAWLALTLSPRQPPAVGLLRNLVRISLASNVNIHIPLVCRVVGDVYPDRQRVNLGDLASSRPARLSVHFVEGHPRWKRVRWSGSGSLADLVSIKEIREESDPACLVLNITADPAKLSHAPKGYLLGRVALYENEPTDEDAITVLLDAMN